MTKYKTIDLFSFAKLSGALSDENRLRALLSLRNGELCVCIITEILKLAPSTVSKHMSILRDAGLVLSRKEGRWIYYRLQAEPDRGVELAALDLLFTCLDKDPVVVEDFKRRRCACKTLALNLNGRKE